MSGRGGGVGGSGSSGQIPITHAQNGLEPSSSRGSQPPVPYGRTSILLQPPQQEVTVTQQRQIVSHSSQHDESDLDQLVPSIPLKLSPEQLQQQLQPIQKRLQQLQEQSQEQSQKHQQEVKKLLNLQRQERLCLHEELQHLQGLLQQQPPEQQQLELPRLLQLQLQLQKQPQKHQQELQELQESQKQQQGLQRSEYLALHKSLQRLQQYLLKTQSPQQQQQLLQLQLQALQQHLHQS